MSSRISYSKPAPEKEIKTVFTLEHHPLLGVIVQMQAVEILPNKEFSMNFSKVRIQNADYYGLSEGETNALEIIEEYENDNLLKLFYKGKKKINGITFFEKHCTKELLEKEIKPFVNEKNVEIFNLLKDREIYYWGQGIVNHWIPIKISSKPSKAVFRVDRNADGLKYSAHLFYDGKEVKLQNEENVIIINKPAYILIEDRIHFIDNEVEAKKLATFFNKTHVAVPKSSEELYLKNIIIPLLKVADVEATGINLEKIVPQKKKAKLNLVSQGKEIVINLSFIYNQHTYNYGSSQNGVSKLEKLKDSWSISTLKRDRKWEQEMAEILAKKGFTLYKDSTFKLVGELSLEKFINETLGYFERKGFEINQDGLKKQFNFSKPLLTYTATEDNDWFDLNIKVKFGQIEIPFKSLKNNILTNNRFLELPNGQIAVIPIEWMQKFEPILDCAIEVKDNIKIGRFHYGLIEDIDEIGINKLGSNIEHLIRSYKSSSDIKAPDSFKANLRKYQQTGLQWLSSLYENRFGGLLADDMGLGKTIQTLAFFEWFKKNKVRNEKITKGTSKTPFLVIMPTSLLHNWHSEIEKFTDLTSFIYSGNQRNRYIWEYFGDYDIILTTYGTIRNDRDVFKRAKFDIIVFDEAQNLKNKTSVASKAASELKAKQKILLTGTPIENSTSDLWSLMDIANPGLLGSFTKFTKNFMQQIDKNKNLQKVEELKKLTSPFILRRTKEQVAKELPPKHEQIVYCSMKPEQDKIYEKTKSYFRNELLKTISERGIKKSKIHILKGLMKLRQIANHPILAERDFDGESGKFSLIMESLQNITERGNKVLLFSQFVSQLTLFRNELDALGIKYCYIDGRLNSKERADEIKKFQKTDEYKIFLISLKAGGVGLNLTAADYVFIADPWWNPAVERQAMDRAHRIGREKPVFVYKYITENTVEEKIITLQEKKKSLAKDIISENNNSWLADINKKNLEEIFS